MSTQERRQESDSLEDLSDTEQQALDLIRSEDGIVQSRLWKELDISSRHGSEIARRLAAKGLISRTKTSYEGNRTFILKPTVGETSDGSPQAEPSTGAGEEVQVESDNPIISRLRVVGETTISRLQRDLEVPPAEIEAELRRLSDDGIVSVQKQTVYGRDAVVVSLA